MILIQTAFHLYSHIHRASGLCRSTHIARGHARYSYINYRARFHGRKDIACASIRCRRVRIIWFIKSY